MAGSDGFVVEANRRVVGLAVRTRGGFRFFASDPGYRRLEGQIFRRIAQMARRVAEVEKALAPASARLH